MSSHLSFTPPASPEELDAIQGPDVLFQGRDRVVRISEGVVVKYGKWPQHMAEDVLNSRVAADLGIRVPKVLYVPIPPEEQPPWTLPVFSTDGTPYIEPPSVWCICMEEIAGVPLVHVVDSMSDADLKSIGLQLKEILRKMRQKTSTCIGSASGGPFRTLLTAPWRQPSCTFATVQDFINHLFNLLAGFLPGESRAMQIISAFPTDDAICFTHGDLIPKNIMVDLTTCKITAVIDWELGGYYPAFWEYCLMYDPAFMTPGWSKILDVVFPEPQPQKQEQAKAMREMIEDFDMWL